MGIYHAKKCGTATNKRYQQDFALGRRHIECMRRFRKWEVYGGRECKDHDGGLACCEWTAKWHLPTHQASRDSLAAKFLKIWYPLMEQVGIPFTNAGLLGLRLLPVCVCTVPFFMTRPVFSFRNPNARSSWKDSGKIFRCGKEVIHLVG